MLMICDVDGVLALPGRPIERETAELLQKIAVRAKIALASGKPAAYLEGLARGMGLADIANREFPGMKGPALDERTDQFSCSIGCCRA